MHCRFPTQGQKYQVYVPLAFPLPMVHSHTIDFMSPSKHTYFNGASKEYESLSVLVGFHQKPHEEHSYQYNHEVEEEFLRGSFHDQEQAMEVQRPINRAEGTLWFQVTLEINLVLS